MVAENFTVIQVWNSESRLRYQFTHKCRIYNSIFFDGDATRYLRRRFHPTSERCKAMREIEIGNVIFH
jgi:hypothetical protein